MATSSRTRSNGPVLPMSNSFQRSMSPGAVPSSSASAFAYSSSSFSSRFSSHCSSFFNRSSSPTRVNLVGSSQSAPSVRFSIDRPTSPGRSFAVVSQRDQIAKKPIASSAASQRKTCMCSPTNHPGSFKCSLHKGFQNHSHAVSSSSNRLNARRSAMTNSLVRIGSVEGDLVKRALAALIRPSSHQQRRRAAFQPRPSRLSVMSKADDL